MTTLLNCPFCGNKARIISRAIDRKVGDEIYYDIGYDIGCENIHCYLMDGADWHHVSKEKAADLWNKRIVGNKC